MSYRFADSLRAGSGWNCSFFYLALYEILWENIAEPGRPQMTIWIYKHALSVCTTYCFSIAAMVARTRLHVTLNVLRSVSCFLPSVLRLCICSLPYLLVLSLSHVKSIDSSKYVSGVLCHLAIEHLVWNHVGLFVQLPLGDLVSATSAWWPTISNFRLVT